MPNLKKLAQAHRAGQELARKSQRAQKVDKTHFDGGAPQGREKNPNGIIEAEDLIGACTKVKGT